MVQYSSGKCSGLLGCEHVAGLPAQWHAQHVHWCAVQSRLQEQPDSWMLAGLLVTARFMPAAHLEQPVQRLLLLLRAVHLLRQRQRRLVELHLWGWHQVRVRTGRMEHSPAQHSHSRAGRQASSCVVSDAASRAAAIMLLCCLPWLMQPQPQPQPAVELDRHQVPWPERKKLCCPALPWPVPLTSYFLTSVNLSRL
jgi:hypothetical protein